MNRISLIGLAVAFLMVAAGTLLIGAEKDQKTSDKDQTQGKVHTVEASVGYPTNAGTGIQAERQPGQFTIPQGFQGAKLKYSFNDPKFDYQSTKLRSSNIYSVTEKRYMRELESDPDFVLPPGEYKFVVGGLPGATGTLSYTTVPSSGTSLPPKPPSGPKSPPSHSSPPTGFPKPGGEEVLLNLPRDFDVTVPDLAPFGGTEKADPPIIIRFRGQVVSSSHEHTAAVVQGVDHPHQFRHALTMRGTFWHGTFMGTASHVGINRDTQQGIDFFQFKEEAVVQGQANADGKLTITLRWKPVMHQGRNASRGGNGLLAWGEWRDLPMDSWSPRTATFTVQLPVGQLQSTQKLVPDESSESPHKK